MVRNSSLLLLLVLILPLNSAAQERITLADGSILNVFMVEPEEVSAQPRPLLILMGGGPGNASISRDTSQWLGSGFAQRGWMVAVPISPDNRSFRGSTNNAKVVQLIDELQQREDIAAGKVLLAGVSNGGLSALEIARRNPANYFGVAAVPALSNSGTDNEALDGFPIYLRIGGADRLDWAARFDETVNSLSDAGVDLDAAIIEGAPHMFRMDWSTLQPWLEKILAQGK
ncbi:MAG: dienelactone hydrolase family protein [Proteobacteria bacterium]|nr:dienelactone hydrolase family protein [Pseudomonadota bacterium]